MEKEIAIPVFKNGGKTLAKGVPVVTYSDYLFALDQERLKVDQEWREKIEKELGELKNWQLLYGTTKEGVAMAWEETEKAIERWKKALKDLLK